MAEGKVFLSLFHGRDDPYAEMDDWGDEGPILGPIDYVQITYSSYVRISFEGQDFDLTFANDCLGYNGVFYGDFTVIAPSIAAQAQSRCEAPETTMQKLRDQRR